MAFIANFQSSLDFRLEQLKKDVVHVLRKHPQGVNKKDLWALVKKETGREVSCTQYGVGKMSHVLGRWSDVITVSGWPDECLFLKEVQGEERKEPEKLEPVAVGLMAEIQRRAQHENKQLPCSSFGDSNKNSASDVNTNEEGKKKLPKAYEVDNDPECEMIEDVEYEEANTNDYDFVLQQLPIIRSWILEYMTAPRHNGCSRFSRLRSFLKHKLKGNFNHRSFKEETMKQILTEHCQDIVYMEQTEKTLRVHLISEDETEQQSCCIQSSAHSDPQADPPTAMSLMTKLSQSRDTVARKGKPFEKKQTATKASAERYYTDVSSDEEQNPASSVIDLTDDKEVLNTATNSHGLAKFGAPANTSQNKKPMSKFGTFPVPSKLLKPLNKEAQPSQFGQHGTQKQIQQLGPPAKVKQVQRETPDFFSTFAQKRRDPSLPGFRDHVIDLTIEPIDKRPFERKPIEVRPVYVAPGMLPAKEHVNIVAKECVALLADANENVSMERVEKLVCQRFECYNLRQLGIPYADQLPCINELNRLLAKINLYIIVYVKTRIICTLHELKEVLKDYSTGKAGFDSLKLGPLQKFPVVYQQFHFPTEQAEIPKITSMDVLDHFHNYLTKYNMWNKKLDLEPFMDYLVKEYGADNQLQLGIKIRSLPLASAVLKKAQKDSSCHHRQVVQHFKEELKNEIGDAFRKFRACILQTSGEGMAVREHYMKMRPDLAIMEILEKFSVLLMVTQVGDRTTTKAAKFRRLIEEFLTTIKEDDVCKYVVHLAICMTKTEVEEKAMELLTPQKIVIDSDEDAEHKMGISKPPPRKDALIESLKTYIERCLNAGAISLMHLDRIEEKMLEEFGFKAFNMMGYGRFIEFLLMEMKQLLEEGGGLCLGLGSGGTDSDSSFKPHQTDILDFIKQCRQCGLSQAEQIEEALCKQYNVKEVRHLGYGNITRLLSYADKHGRHTFRELTLLYESTLVTNTGFHAHRDSKVGILGHQSKDAAKICLHNCPLLENLADWSQWSLVFEPELGKLKDFVQKYGGLTNKTLEGGKLATIDFLALELKPGEYIKIVSTTSPEHVVEALESHDAQSAAGHLVSMAVAYKGVESMPLALLSGHVKTALLMMHAEETTSDSSRHSATPFDQHKAAMFVLQCLLHIPTKICVSLANQIFLEPLGQVIGSSKSKQLLVQLCSTVTELNHLVQLGCLLGIPEWTDMIQQKCKLPDSAIQVLPPDAEELFGEVNPEQEEEEDIEMFEEDGAEDVDDILAGHLVIDLEAGDEDNAETKVTEEIVEDKTEEAENTDVNKKDVNKEKLDGEDVKTEVKEEQSEIKVADKTDDVPEAEEGNETMPNKKPQVSQCEDIVNQIRRDEFGVGVQLSEEGQRLMRVQQERLGRSLDRLSKDLYSKDTHFVLELVQNADDNSYHDNLLNNTTDECPSVKFIIENDGIYVYNNESGFREKDIRALCDVGRSTKGKHKFGYIGQKGIGFKSVFRITDAPEVHSNGYHIRFDVNSGPMGYILPHWVPEKDRASQDGWMTHIMLRLKPDMRVQTRTLAARFNDIHPSLLLFLHRLRKITIENKVENSIQTMRRRDVGESVVEIQHSHGCDRWLVVKKVLDAKKISIQTKSGADVESTEVALAFPLKKLGQELAPQAMPPKQPVFAFLPLRSYGFRFIVQGDFDVPSSREDVDKDSPWNQWLRNEIHQVFVEALDVFKTHSEFNSMEAVCAFLQFVPMEDEVLEFFKPVASDILKKLKAKPCVPTQPNSQGVISWKIPSQTVRVRDPLVRSVITPDLLQTHLNLYYLHTDVASMLNPTLTSCLGIETLTSDHLFQLGKALVVNMGSHCTKQEDIELIAKWMACLYRSLDEFHHEDAVLSTLKACRLLPLSDGQLVSMQERTVFYPIEDSSSKRRRRKHKESMYYIQQDVNSLHPLLLNTDDDEVNSQVHKLLLRLGIKQLSPFDIINHHILPVMKSDSWMTKSDETLIAYLVYIKEESEKQTSVCNLDEVKDVAMVKTNLGFKIPSKEPVHFPPSYGNQVNLQETFSGYNWTLLDDCYIAEHCSEHEVHSWMDFFRKLSVEDFLSIRQRHVHLKKENLADSLWKSLSSQWPDHELEFVVHDYYSAELEGLILNNKATSENDYAQQMKHLCVYLDKHWGKFSKFCVTQVYDKEGKILKDTETSFSVLLRTSQWLPAVQIVTSQDFDGSIAREFKMVIQEPSSLYIDTKAVRKLLSDNVLYLDVTCTGEEFLKFLGLQMSVSVETVKEYVLKWGERSEGGVPATFCTSLEHMKNIYLYLDKELKRKEFQDMLREKPVFFVPEKGVSYLHDKTEVVAGKMLKRSEVWLSDKTGLLEKHHQILEACHSEICRKRTIEGFYKDRKDLVELFRQEGRLDTQPKVEEYIELLYALCSTYTPKDSKILSDVLYIYSTIGQALVMPPDNMPDEQTADMALEALKSTVKNKLQNKKVFPTSKHIWVSLDDVPLINDNKEMEKMFRDKPGVHFLDMEDQASKIFKVKRTKPKAKKQKVLNVLESRIQPDMIDEVIEICGIKKLSEVVDIVPTPDMVEPSKNMKLYFSRIIPHLQQYLMAKYGDVYHELELIKTKQMLKDAKFFQAGRLEVSYWLTTMSEDTFVVQQQKCNISPPEFYFHKDYINSMADVNKEVARYFSCGDSDCMTALRSFLSELAHSVSGVTGESVQEVLQRYEADCVEVADKDKWIVKAPMITIPLDTQPALEPESSTAAEPEKEPVISEQKPLELPVWPSLPENKGKKRENKDRGTTWQPTETIEYMKSVRALPENIRMVRKDANKEEGEIGDNKQSKEIGDSKQSKEIGDSKHLGTRTESKSVGTFEESEAGSEKTRRRKRIASGTDLEVCPEKKLKEKHIQREENDEAGALTDSSDEERPRRSFSDTRHNASDDWRGRAIDEDRDEARRRFRDDYGRYRTRYDGLYRSSDDEDDRERRRRRRYEDPDEDKFFRSRRRIKGDPVWNRIATEYTFDELGEGNELEAAKTLTLGPEAADSEVGRWGEKLVAQYLDKQKEMGNIIEYMWRNDEDEVGDPFDFEVMVKDENGFHKDYIEVKSTKSNNKEVFQISVQQIKFADEKKNRFHIYRVFNAGDSERVRLIRITDLDTRLSTKQVRLCMLI